MQLPLVDDLLHLDLLLDQLFDDNDADPSVEQGYELMDHLSFLVELLGQPLEDSSCYGDSLLMFLLEVI